MKVIIAGGRDFDNYELLKSVCSQFIISEVVSGCARGADTLGERFAKEHNIPIKRFPAAWEIGNQAGIIRNMEMGDYADFLIAFWDQKSKGTNHMINYMRRIGKHGKVVFYETNV